MSGVLVKLDSLKVDLPGAEKQVAKYVLSNAEQIPFQSVYDIAKDVKVSVASVSRLARKAGCIDFKEFKIKIAQEVSTSVSAIFQGSSEKDSDDKISRKVFGGNIKSLEDTLKILDVSALTKAAKAICRCDSLLCCGLGSSGNIAQDSAFRFAHFGIRAQDCTDPLQIIVRTARLGKRDILLGMSHSGRSEMTIQCMELAHKQKALTIGISNYPASPLAKISDIFFCTSFPENRVRAASLSSRISQICLLDTLCLLVAKHMKDLKYTAFINELTEKFVRRASTRRRSRGKEEG